MPYFNIIRKTEINNKSFMVAQLYDQFDLKEDNIIEKFEGQIDLPVQWNIGVIVGRSGTGKTTIARELFNKYFCSFKYSSNSVIDDFNKKTDINKIFSMLMSVGFSSPLSWLKPFSVLSNGEKMRVNLARAVLQKKKIIVFDEYTSVVDREIAKIGSLALQKAIKKMNKKFIVVTCHQDVIEWLEPDWVFNTDIMQYENTRGLLRRPKIKIEIKEIKGFWSIFTKYHYLNHTHAKNAREFVGFINDNPICFVSFIYFPSVKYKTMMKGHRLVVLPDYQGVGIAKKILNIVVKKLSEKIEFVGFTTSLNLFAKSFRKDINWKLISVGRMSRQGNFVHMNKTGSYNRNTLSFRYINNNMTI